MRLVRVDINATFYAVIETERDVQSLAVEAIGDSMDPADFSIMPVRSLADVKYGWDGGDIPYGDNQNRTIAEWIDD
jgi:hypothetical protein